MATGNASTRDLYALECALLCALVFVLPLLEAPKNLLSLGFALAWLSRSGFGRNFGWLPRIWDLAFAAIPLAALLSTALATPYPMHWSELVDVLRYSLLGWMLARSRVSVRQYGRIAASALLAIPVTLAYGYWEWKIAGRTRFLELNSVGHVNHSALYFCAAVLWLAGCAAARWAALKLSLRIAAVALVLAGAAMLLVWESRGAVLTFATGMVLILWRVARSRQRPVWPMLGLGLLFAATILALQPYQLKKTLANATGKVGLSSYRVQLANVAVEGFRQRPLTGMGPGNFREISEERVTAWVAARSERMQSSDYFYGGHGHSLYANTLGERGAAGIVALALLGFAWVRELRRRHPTGIEPASQWLAWSSGLAGIVLVFVGGLFNTTLHHEHGMLAMLLLGLMLGLDRRPAVA